jgi:hypothetical protein
VDNGPASYIKRDVHGMVPAQRLDLELSGTDNGLDSFGPGVWMFHDHVEKSFTTNGVGEGGDISLVVYKGYADERGIPKLHGMSLAPYFTKEFWQGKYPMWQDYDAWKSLGLPEIRETKDKAFVVTPPKAPMTAQEAAQAENSDDSLIGQLIYGLVLGALAYLAYSKREKIIAWAKK